MPMANRAKSYKCLWVCVYIYIDRYIYIHKHHILGYIPSSMASRVREGILPLCFAFVRPPPKESCIKLWSPKHRKDMDLLEWSQRKPQK